MNVSTHWLSLFILAFLFFSCKEEEETITPDAVTIQVDANLFLTNGVSEPITIVSKTLSDGSTADCYKIVTKGIPSDHQMGPWCPTNTLDDATKGGIWINKGIVYDVDGAFIKNLSNAQYKLVWHNAAIELSEASKKDFQQKLFEQTGKNGDAENNMLHTQRNFSANAVVKLGPQTGYREKQGWPCALQVLNKTVEPEREIHMKAIEQRAGFENGAFCGVGQRQVGNHAVGVAEAHHLRGAAQCADHGVERDHHALGLAGTARGVQHGGHFIFAALDRLLRGRGGGHNVVPFFGVL